MQKLVKCCGSLLIVDEENFTVWFIHGSVQQFLYSQLVNEDVKEFKMDLASVDLNLGEICVSYLHSERHITQLVQRKHQLIASSATLNTMIRNSNIAGKLAIRLLSRKKNVEHSMRPTLEDVGILRKSYIPQAQSYNRFLPYAQEHWLPHTKQVDRKIHSRIWPHWKRLVTGNVPVARLPWTPEKCFEFGPTFVNYVLQTRQWNLILVSLIDAKYSSIRNLRPIFELINMAKEESIVFSRSIPGEQQLISFLQPFFAPKKWNSSAMKDDVPVLHAAAGCGYVDSVQILLDDGVDVNLQAKNCTTALYAVCEYGCEGIVKLLLENGADVTLLGGDYGTALNIACWNIHEKIVKLLLENGTDVHLQGGAFGTALNTACWQGHENIVKLLLENGADINLRGASGRNGTALYAACSNGSKRIVKLLLENGPDVNLQGGVYGTALNAACFYGHEDIVKLLLKNGADVNLIGGELGTALASARKSSSRGKIGKLLLEHGAIEKWDR